MISRRKIVKGMAMMSGILLAPFDRLIFTEQRRKASMVTTDGELFAGFLLLTNGEELPDWVKPAVRGTPHFCGVTDVNGRTNPPTAKTIYFKDILELARNVEIPVYKLSNLPDALREVGGTVIRHLSGELYSATLFYQSYDQELGLWLTTVRLHACADFTRPYPVWQEELLEEIEILDLTIQKTDQLPFAGIVVPTALGYVFNWIENDVLYTLIAENTLDKQIAEELSMALMPITS